ncbi:unnamed protein product [Urochloa humidicola]
MSSPLLYCRPRLHPASEGVLIDGVDLYPLRLLQARGEHHPHPWRIHALPFPPVWEWWPFFATAHEITGQLHLLWCLCSFSSHIIIDGV